MRDTASQENLSHDIVPVEAEYDYMTIGVAVLATFKHAVENYDFSFMLKVRPVSSYCYALQSQARILQPSYAAYT